ncbi:MAG: AmmeMemoRadiSam system protein A [bacterium]
MKNFDLTENEKSILIKIARKSIEDRFDKNRDTFINSKELLPALTDNLKTKAGVFVTLKTGGEQLRGCIGNFNFGIPVYQNVYNMAKEAAFGDPRFMPLNNEELQKIKIEISVLTPLEKVDSLDNIEIGKHGVYLIKGPCHGVLLPQVATECNMDRQGFLEAVSMKAGLSPDAYKDGADICTFSAIVFGEN